MTSNHWLLVESSRCVFCAVLIPDSQVPRTVTGSVAFYRRGSQFFFLVISGEFSSGFSEKKTNGPKMSRANQRRQRKFSRRRIDHPILAQGHFRFLFVKFVQVE